LNTSVRTYLVPLVAALVAVLGCQRPPPMPAPSRVFLLTVDTLRADHMSLYGYPRATTPRLAALASSGVVFTDAVTQWPKTGSSFAAMFTGRYPQTTGLMQRAALRIPGSYLTLPEMMHDAGYTTAAVVSSPVLSAKLGWNRGFDDFRQTWGDGDVAEDPHQFRGLVQAPVVNRIAQQVLAGHAHDRKLFLWVHYIDPHAPYALPPGVDNPFAGDRYYTDRTAVPPHSLRINQLGPERERRFYAALYDANIRLVDRSLDELLSAARRLRQLDDALVIVTADHGESLGEHESWFEHGPLPYDSTARVPLVVFGKGVLAGHRVEHPVELVDLFPTLHALAAPRRTVHGVEGKSLVPWLRERSPGGEVEAEFRYAFSEAGYRPHYYRSVRDGRWKLIQGFGRRVKRLAPAAGWELYDLASDPGETRNLAAVEHAELRRLRAVLLRWSRTGAEKPDLAGKPNEEEAERALHALGYANGN